MKVVGGNRDFSHKLTYFVLLESVTIEWGEGWEGVVEHKGCSSTPCWQGTAGECFFLIGEIKLKLMLLHFRK
jgi:hypothetical protein